MHGAMIDDMRHQLRIEREQDATSGSRRTAKAVAGAHPLAQLQQRVGNRAVVRLLEERAEAPGPPARPGSLVVGSALDPAEREADVMAAGVMKHLGVRPVHFQDRGASARRLADEVIGPEGGQTSRDTDALIQRARSAGQGLPSGLRVSMEDAFGADLSSVRVHTGPAAQEASARLGARAFTHGSDVFFGRGEYRPGTSEGQHVLAHELTHTLQQSGSTRRRIAPDEMTRRLADDELPTT